MSMWKRYSNIIFVSTKSQCPLWPHLHQSWPLSHCRTTHSWWALHSVPLRVPQHQLINQHQHPSLKVSAIKSWSMERWNPRHSTSRYYGGRYVYWSWIMFFTKLHNRFTNPSILSMCVWLVTFWQYLEQWFPLSASFQGLSTFALTTGRVWRLWLLHRLCVQRSGCGRVWWSGIEVLGVQILWLCHWEYFIKFCCL